MATKPKKRVRPKIKPAPPIRKKEPKFVVTEQILEEIQILSGRGLTNEMIFHYYGIGKTLWYDTVQKHPEIGDIIRQGKAKTVSFVSGELMKKIKQGNLSAIIFYLKTQARWSEHNTLGIEGGDKPAPGALTINVTDPVEASKIYQQIMIGS